MAPPASWQPKAIIDGIWFFKRLKPAVTVGIWLFGRQEPTVTVGIRLFGHKIKVDAVTLLQVPFHE